jgi:toxin ParE1/3/4
MGRVLYSLLADQDLLEIWLHIAPENEQAADRLLDTIQEKAKVLAVHPEMGRERPDLAAEIRSFPVHSYLVLYRVISGGIEVARVLHGARDISSHLN